MTPQVFQSDPQVTKKTKSHPQTPKVTSTWPQNAPARSVARSAGVVGPVLTKQNPSQICVFLLYGPVWAEHKAIWYALSVKFDVYTPKVPPKWPQRGPKVTLICQKWSQSNPKSIQISPNKFIKSLKPRGLQASKPRSLEVPRRESRSEINSLYFYGFTMLFVVISLLCY